jgi:branched-chain amino acid transport system ATP-binding protein
VQAGYLSGGEQQILAIGRALMVHPRLLQLHELSIGLAPVLVKEIYQIIQRLNREENVAVLLVEQNVQMAALSVAERGYVIKNGSVALDAPAEELRRNRDIKEFYLGLGTEEKLGHLELYLEGDDDARKDAELGREKDPAASSSVGRAELCGYPYPAHCLALDRPIE